ncbi:MAG: hypothetical protein MK073_02125 [Phycisphaerales bacterium]|nr:hypothetical protein [Phycisphaerales bacterium]
MNMKTIALTLWDLLAKPEPPAPKHKVKKSQSKPRPIQAKYDALVEQMKETYGFRIRKWRSSMSGCAWELKDKHGNITRMVESPYPKGPMSCAIFLHEVGHHAIGFHVYKPRCLEEYHAWEWSLKAMSANGIRITENVLKRRDDALRYALAKALRRGLKKIPVELMQYLPEQRKVVA